MVAYARANSPFYREMYSGVPESPKLYELPVLDKHRFTDRFEDIATDDRVTAAGARQFVEDDSRAGQLFLDKYGLWATSGSTGVAALSLHDAVAREIYRSFRWTREKPLTAPAALRLLGKGMRVAVPINTSAHQAGSSSVLLAKGSFPRLTRGIRLFSLTAPVEQLVEDLNRFDPGALAGYPSIIETLAEEAIAGRLKIRPVAVICSAEVLTPEARSVIESAFNAPVFDEYNATEFAPIALRRPCGWMHVNADWVIVEPVEADHSPTPAGRPSHGLLLTNLANRIQPLIRFELGDQVTVRPDPCPCGSPLPAIRVDGRTSDRVQFQDPQGEMVILLGMNLYTIFLDVPGVAAGQALQTGDDELEIRLRYRPGFNPVDAGEQVLGMVRRLLAGNKLANVALTLSEEPPARDPRSEKYRVLWDARPGPGG